MATGHKIVYCHKIVVPTFFARRWFTSSTYLNFLNYVRIECIHKMFIEISIQLLKRWKQIPNDIWRNWQKEVVCILDPVYLCQKKDCMIELGNLVNGIMLCSYNAERENQNTQRKKISRIKAHVVYFCAYSRDSLKGTIQSIESTYEEG